MDSVGLLVEGVDLFSGASEEHLVAAVTALVDGVRALVVGGQRVAQVSLPAAHLEVVLSRQQSEIAVEVVSLGRPARQLRPAVLLDAEALAAAVVEGASTFLADLQERVPDEARTRELQKTVRQLKALAGSSRRTPPPALPRSAAALYLLPSAYPGFSATLEDPSGRIASWRRGGKAPLATLLGTGELSLHFEEGGEPVFTSDGAPFLQALELARGAEELLRAMELGESRHGLAIGSDLSISLPEGRLTRGRSGNLGTIPPAELAAAMFALGQELSVRIIERWRSQATNPYLRELSIRCAAGLAQLRTPDGTRPPSSARAAKARPTPAPRPPATPPPRPASTPVVEDGELRALRFEPHFRSRPIGGPALRVLDGDGGPIVVGAHHVAMLGRDGVVHRLLEGERGVAALPDGRVLVARTDRVLLHTADSDSARWLQSHDGLPLGPSLWDLDGELLTLSEDRTLLAYSTVTGRELWRMAVPKAVRAFSAVEGRTVVLTTDSGVLLGLEATDGQRRYQLRGRMGFAGPAQFSDGAMLVTLHSGSDAAVVAAESASGAVAWMKEGLQLHQPTVPCVSGQWVYVLGRREEEACLVCLAPGGEVRFERTLPLGPGPYALCPADEGVIAMSSDGTAARVDAAGKLRWRIGSAGEPQPSPLSPILRRGVLVLPGHTVRAVDPTGGRVLAELSTDAPLVDFAVSDALDLYLLDEEGVLVAHRLVSHLALLETGSGT